MFFCCLSGCFSWYFLVVFLFFGVFTSIFKICILFRVFFCNKSENGCFLRMCFFHQSQKLLFVVWFLRYFFFSYFLSFSMYFLLLVFSMFFCVVFCLKVIIWSNFKVCVLFWMSLKDICKVVINFGVSYN